MHCLLVHLSLAAEGRNQIMVPPMGLFSLAGWLKRQGHQVEIVHAGLSPQPFSIVDEISLRGARAVFFPMHWTRQIGPVLDAATEIKKILPGVVVFLGGFTASFFARAILEKFPAVDAVVRGDGELPAQRLSEQLEKRYPDFSKVPNLVWRQKNRIVENQTAFFVDREFSRGLDHACFELLENRNEYFSRLLYADFDTESEAGRRHAYRRAFFYNPGKGCPGRCACCGASWWARKFTGCRRHYYFFPPEKVLADLQKAWQHGARTWRVSFDPEPQRSYYLELFSRLRTLKITYRLVFDCFALPDEEFVKEVQRTFSPDSVLVVSAECGSERVRGLNRSFYFSNRELLKAIRVIGQCGLQAHVFFSAGLPFEARADLRKSMELIKKLKDFHCCGITVCPMELDPGAPAFMKPANFGTQLTRKGLEDFRKEPPLLFRSGYHTKFFREEAISEAVESLTHVARA